EQSYQEYMQPGAYRSAPLGQPKDDAYRSVPSSSYPAQPAGRSPYTPLSPTPGTFEHEQARPTYQNSYRQGGYITGDNSGAPFGPPPGAGQPGPKRKRNGLRTGAIMALTLVLAMVFGVGLFAGWQFGRTNSSTSTATVPSSNNSSLQPGTVPQPTVPALTNNNMQAVREAVVAKTRPAVVQINVQTQKGTALGSGVIIDKRGYIVTNNHVVDGVTTVDEVVLSDGTRIRNAQVVGTDPADDLAIIKINPPTNMAVISLGDSSQLRVGQDVLAIGNPLGNTQTVTNGIVSALGRNVSEGNGAIIPNAIQTDAPINPGNSGGALVDLQGNLIGIPTLTAVDPEFNSPANGVGFAIPSNRVQFIATQLINNGRVQHTGRAAIGISPTQVDPTLQMQDNLAVDHGVYVTRLTAGGAAEKAGIKAGDVIVQIDNKAIDSIPSLEDALIAKNPGDKATVKVYRGTQQITFTVTLGELNAG
ncbi:S1C family serine protease, partial [Dictyobacter formicarum]|uniref:S1C family serine protease n=1 Tax=Dictyobacter formicarum TaxID=2778368 RepID=UPI0027E48F3A